jgi:peroxiredoxin
MSSGVVLAGLLFFGVSGHAEESLRFETSEPELVPQPDWAPGLLSREQYVDFVEKAGGADHMVTLHEDPETTEPLVGYGFNFVFGGLNRGFAVFGTAESGYRLYADVDADGSLADEGAWRLSRTDGRYVVPFEITDQGQAEGRPVEFPIRSRFVVYPAEAGSDDRARGVWNSQTVRRGEIEVGGRKLEFELHGHSGRYNKPNQAIWIDLDGDGQGGRSRESPERFRNLDEYVNIGETTYAFDVDPFGRHLALTPLDEARAERPSLAEGEAAPNFEATAVDGESISLADYLGEWVLLYFWADWCGPCHDEAPRLAEHQRRWRESGFQILGITTDIKDTIDTFTAEYGHDWPQISEAFEGPVHRAYRVAAYPTKYLIDREGDLVCGSSGPAFWNDCWPQARSNLQSAAE